MNYAVQMNTGIGITAQKCAWASRTGIVYHLPVFRGTCCLPSYCIQTHQEWAVLLVYAIGFSISIVLYLSPHCLRATWKMQSIGCFPDHLQLWCVPCSSTLLLAGGSCVCRQYNITGVLGPTGHPCSVSLLRPCLWPTLRTGNMGNVLEVHLNRLCRHAQWFGD